MSPALAAAVFLVSATVPALAQSREQMLVDEKTSTLVEVTGVYSFVPPTGYAPFRIKAVNNTTGDLAVSLETVSEASRDFSDEHELESRFSFTAAAGKTTEREILVPLCANSQSSRYSSPVLRATVQAGGRKESFRFSTGGCSAMPFTAFTTALAGKTLTDINNAANPATGGYSRGDSNFAALCDPGMLSGDWRAYSGLDAFGISSVEWPTLQPAVKSAVLQWVKLGGSLNIYFPKGAGGLDTLGITVQGKTPVGPDFGGTAYQLGNGRICDLSWDGVSLGTDIVNEYGTNSKSSSIDVQRLEYAEALRKLEQVSPSRPSVKPALVDALGEKSFAAWQVGVILFIFGVVVGPVNLFYLAGKGRRHRLFFTTPIISLAAAVLLLVVIFFQDGTGGTGHRASVVYLDSAENSACIHQMQVSRTGVLFGSAFTLEENAVVNMAILPESRWTRLKGPYEDENWGMRYSYRRNQGKGESQHYSILDQTCGGDWFQSRSEQAQFIDAVQSTRGRLELKPGSNPPVITSTLKATLERVCFVDAAGKVWASAGAVTTGADTPLAEIDSETFGTWRESVSAVLPRDLREFVRSHNARGFFYASSTDPAAGMVDTLDSIEWESNNVFLYGPLK